MTFRYMPFYTDMIRLASGICTKLRKGRKRCKGVIRAIQLSEDLVEEGHPSYHAWTLPEQLCLSHGLPDDKSTIVEARTILFQPRGYRTFVCLREEMRYASEIRGHDKWRRRVLWLVT